VGGQIESRKSVKPDAGERYHDEGASSMHSTILDLGEDLSGLLATLGRPIEQTAREMIVLELYRQSLISSGKQPNS
jgi:hypothetical protein